MRSDCLCRRTCSALPNDAGTGIIERGLTQADRDAGVRHDGLTTAERQELTRLRREVRQLKMERGILSQAAPWFARETGAAPPKGGTDS